MKVRLSLALVACVVGVSLIPGTAAADRPEKDEFSPVGDLIDCDGTVLEVTGGLVVERSHEHVRSDRVRVIFSGAPRHVTAEDEEGTVYRVVGAGIRGNLTFDPEADPGDEIGIFRIRLNIIGPGGLFGKVNIRESRKKKDEPGFTVRDKGNCQFVDEDDEE